MEWYLQGGLKTFRVVVVRLSSPAFFPCPFLPPLSLNRLSSSAKAFRLRIPSSSLPHVDIFPSCDSVLHFQFVNTQCSALYTTHVLDM